MRSLWLVPLLLLALTLPAIAGGPGKIPVGKDPEGAPTTADMRALKFEILSRTLTASSEEEAAQILLDLREPLMSQALVSNELGVDLDAATKLAAELGALAEEKGSDDFVELAQHADNLVNELIELEGGGGLPGMRTSPPIRGKNPTNAPTTADMRALKYEILSRALSITTKEEAEQLLIDLREPLMSQAVISMEAGVDLNDAKALAEALNTHAEEMSLDAFKELAQHSEDLVKEIAAVMEEQEQIFK